MRASPRRDRPWLNLGLLLATVLSTTVVGACQHQGFAANLDPVTETPFVLWHGLWYSLTVLAILGIHELGHYYACRHYRIDASLPYFLPAPFLIGTLGAFIRIRQPIPTKRMLFDIGVAGPIAASWWRAALFVGVGSRGSCRRRGDRVCDDPRRTAPVPLRGVGRLGGGRRRVHAERPPHGIRRVGRVAGHRPQPVPDRPARRGAHLVRGLRARSTLVTLISAAVLFALAFHSPSWIVWAVLMVVMLVALGPRHPRTLDHDIPIDRTRMCVAALALVIFVLCFTPAPIQIIGELGP
ncbi:MAG: site-2 protease family protein [Acidobacteria bacterium]|nr:site-2 protease family protein [Acidobacteriota bacterium]